MGKKDDICRSITDEIAEINFECLKKNGSSDNKVIYSRKTGYSRTTRK
ncbi:MAG: hypothetical protein JW776_16070 [Candidatus Lokiarchaeota archaeon]|nr:hypothetical protein [Candidatus Lokiarchaeota archaeon]